MISLLKKLHHSQGIRQSIVTISGNLAAAGFSAVALMLISRNLGPVHFGYFSVGFALVLIISRIMDTGLTQTMMRFVPQAKDYTESGKLISLATRIKLLAYTLIAVLGVLVTPLLSRILNFEMPIVLVLAFVLSGATVGFEHIIGILQSLHRFSRAVTANLMQAGSKLLTAIILSITNPAAIVVAFVAYMASPVVPVLLSKWLIPNSVKINLFQNLSKERRVVSKMASHAAIGYIAAGLIENVDVLFVQAYTDPVSTGVFGGTSRIAMLFMVLAFSLANVLSPRVARYKDKVHLSKFLRKACFLAILSVIAGLLIMPLSGLIIRFTIGPAYLSGVVVLQILIATAFITIASVPFIAMFFAFEKAEWYFSVSGILQLLVIVMGNMLFVPTYGIEAAAWTRLASKLVLFSFTAGLGWYYYRKLRDKDLLSKENQPEIIHPTLF